MDTSDYLWHVTFEEERTTMAERWILTWHMLLTFGGLDAFLSGRWWHALEEALPSAHRTQPATSRVASRGAPAKGWLPRQRFVDFLGMRCPMLPRLETRCADTMIALADTLTTYEFLEEVHASVILINFCGWFGSHTSI